MTCPLLRSRTAVTVALQDCPSLDCTVMFAPASSGGRAEVSHAVDGSPAPVVQAVGAPTRQGGISLQAGRELTIEGFLDEAAQPSADVDIALLAQSCDAVAHPGIDTDLENFITLHDMIIVACVR